MRWNLERQLQIVVESENNILFEYLGELIGKEGIIKGSENLNTWTLKDL